MLLGPKKTRSRPDNSGELRLDPFLIAFRRTLFFDASAPLSAGPLRILLNDP